MVKFGADGKVIEVDTVGLDAGRNIQPVARTTPTHGTQMSVIEQLIGNLGRFKKKGRASTALGTGFPPSRE